MKLNYQIFSLIFLFVCMNSPIQSMDLEQYDEKKDSSICNFFKRMNSANKSDNDFLLFQEASQKSLFSKLADTLCCKKNQEADEEIGLGNLQFEGDQEEKISKCLGMPIEKWKKIGGNAAEISTKLAIALGGLKLWGETELTFFAQDNAAEAIGEHIKFKKWKAVLYPLSLVGMYGAAVGMKYFDSELTDYYTGYQVVLGLTTFKIINNFFSSLNRGENKEIQDLQDQINQLRLQIEHKED